MRLTQPDQVVLLDPATHPLVFRGNKGEQFQVSVLEHDLVRVQHFPDGTPRLDRTWTVVGADGDVPHAGRRRDDLTPFTRPGYQIDAQTGGWQLRTALLRVDIALNPFALRWSDESGRVFAADVSQRAYPYDRASRMVRHYLERRAGEHYYGFGEQAGPLDKAGRRLRLCPLDALGYDAEHGGPLYKHIPFYITFVPDLQVAYGLFYDNLAITTFDLGCEIDNYYGPYRTYQAEDGDLDYYLIYGPTIPEVVEKFATLTGRMALPPRWSLGYFGSTMNYTEAPDAQEQLKQFVELCQAHRIPCDLFNLSSGYTTGEDGKRYVFNWNRHRIPDPRAMTDHFHRAGIRLAANIKPCLLTSHPRYAEVAALGGFIRQAESDQPEVGLFWGGDGSHLDFTNPAAFAWWKARVREALLEWGIDATWNDNNEYQIWDDEARCDGQGDPLPLGQLRPVQTLLMVRASTEAQQEFRPDERPFVLTRSGCPGVQRYAQTWTGDNYTSWHTLRYNTPMGLGLSLSGMPNMGHDVGGLVGPKPEPELFARWVQMGVFHPRFCIHSWNSDGTVNEPWMHPEVLPIVRDWIEFRYRLIPYFYTLFFEAAQTGCPILRPLVYHFAADPRCHNESFEFMLGPHLLVAPVLEPGARTWPVYLPAGTDWCDFYSGAWHSGGQTVTVDAPLDRIPLFVPAGGIIPTGKTMQYVGAQPDDLRRVYLFPHPDQGVGTFNLIEDDGISLGYRRGEYATVQIVVRAEAETLGLSCAVAGNYPLPYRQIECVLPPGETRPVVGDGLGGQAAESEWQGRRRIVVPLFKGRTDSGFYE